MKKMLKKWGSKLKKITSNKNFIKKVSNVLVTVAYVVFVVAIASEVAFAEDILDNFGDLLASIKGAILKYSTMAVVIGIGIGAMMKKFSMGKQDKIEMGNKLMRDSIIAYLVLNATPRILNFVTSKVGTGNESINF